MAFEGRKTVTLELAHFENAGTLSSILEPDPDRRDRLNPSSN